MAVNCRRDTDLFRKPETLEAKLVLGESLLVRVASEFIENNGEEAQSQETMGEEKRKHLKGCQER